MHFLKVEVLSIELVVRTISDKVTILILITLIMLKLLSKIVVGILAPIVTLISLPIFFLLWLLNGIGRFIVSRLLARKYNGRVTLVPTGNDGIWGYKKSGSSRNALTAIVSNTGLVEFAKIAETSFTDEIFKHKNSKGRIPYEKLKKILTTDYGYVCWKEDEHFDIKNHIRVLDKDFRYSQTDFMNLMSTLVEDMEESKPQWEVIIVPRYDDGTEKEKSVIIFRFLHAYMDGLSCLLLIKDHLAENLELVIDPLKVQIPLWKMTLFYINSFLFGPYVMIKMIVSKHWYKPWILMHSSEVPSKNFVYSDNLGLAMISKARKNADGASVSNVLATAVVAAMKKVIPAERLISSVTVADVVALVPYPNSDPQNRFTHYSYKIRTDDEDVIEKLKRTKRDSLKKLLGPELLTFFYMFKLFGTFPVAFFPLFTNGAYDSFFVSNIPLSKTKVSYKGGFEWLYLIGWPPHPNDTGISLSATSLNNQIRIGAVADSRWLTKEELQQIMKLIPQEIANMAEDSIFKTYIV